MNRKRSNDDLLKNLEKLNSYQANLFGDKTDISNVRIFENSTFDGEQLFGKADAFMEDFEVLKGYAIERSDYDDFYDADKSLILVCAAKGMGKTTLFKLWENRLAETINNLTLVPNYSDITGFNGISDFAELSNVWKKKLLLYIIRKMCSGRQAVQIVERMEAIKSATRKGNVCDFLVSSIRACDEELNTNHTKQIEEIEEHRKSVVWFFLDEFDADFTREVSSINKMAALLNAARDLTAEFHNIKIRISIRPNVWANLRNNNALMTNFKELMMPLDWSSTEIRSILAKRVECYITNLKYLSGLNWDLVGFSQEEKEKWLISQIFDTEKFDLGKGNRPTEVVLTKLCAERPRWVIELCKAANKAKKNRPGVINIKDVEGSFREIGSSRSHDIKIEYQIYCPKVSDILTAFYNSKPSYTLLDLISYIESEITSKVDIEIVGISKKCSAKQVANFLYELTFIEPKKILSKREHEFLHFRDFPDIIDNSITNNLIQEDLYWVVHPAFRNSLNIGIPSNAQFEE